MPKHTGTEPKFAETFTPLHTFWGGEDGTTEAFVRTSSHMEFPPLTIHYAHSRAHWYVATALLHKEDHWPNKCMNWAFVSKSSPVKPQKLTANPPLPEMLFKDV